MKCLSSKSGRGTRITRLHKREVSSLTADKIKGAVRRYCLLREAV